MFLIYQEHKQKSGLFPEEIVDVIVWRGNLNSAPKNMENIGGWLGKNIGGWLGKNIGGWLGKNIGGWLGKNIVGWLGKNCSILT